jgi:predicted metal-binding protein
VWQGLGNHDTDPEKVLFIVDDRACVVAFSAPHKPTYLFSTINPDSATALLEFGTHYAQSKTGNIPHKQFPEPLQVVAIAKVPSLN